MLASTANMNVELQPTVNRGSREHEKHMMSYYALGQTPDLHRAILIRLCRAWTGFVCTHQG